MALIKCPECEREISDRAGSCPHCGCPLSKESASAIFMLKREPKAFFCAVKYEVYLDYQMCGTLKNGDTLKEILACGNHHLKLIDKNNFNTIAYENDFYLSNEGLVMSFSAAMKITMSQIPYPLDSTQNNQPKTAFQAHSSSITHEVSSQARAPKGRICPKCGGNMTVQTISESRKSGCATILLYIILALTIFGLLIVIPLMLRKKSETVTYSVCQQCGYKEKL